MRWHTVTQGKGSEGGNWRMEWVASTLHTTSEHVVSSITTAHAHNSAASSRLNWRSPADLNGLVRFAERQNLASARVCHHISNSAQHIFTSHTISPTELLHPSPVHFKTFKFTSEGELCSNNFHLPSHCAYRLETRLCLDPVQNTGKIKLRKKRK